MAMLATVPALRAQSGLDHHDRLLAVRAAVNGKTEAVVLIATTLGRTGAVLDTVRALGGRVEVRFDDVGYVRVRLPLAQFARVRAGKDVLAASVDDGNLSYSYAQGTDLKATQISAQLGSRFSVKRDTTRRAARPMPDGALASASPYIPTAELGLSRFQRAHPTFDGRGVTIAVLEGGELEFDHPALQRATALTGDSVPKIRGIIDPALFATQGSRDTALLWRGDNDYQGVRGSGAIDAPDGTFLLNGMLYHAPRAGRYRAGVYVRGGLPTEPDGPRSSDTTMYGVVWDEARRLVWVDANRNRDFGDEAPVLDLNLGFSVGHFPAETTGTTPKSAIPFAVALDSAGWGVHLYTGGRFGRHATMDASNAAGAHLLGGVGSGSAPGAQIIVVAAWRSLSDEIEGFIRAARDPRVDLITCSQSGEVFPGTGESIIGVVLDRVVQRYGKPIFAAADNAGPIVGTTLGPGSSPRVISVGAYGSRATYRVHHGWELPTADLIPDYSSRGPTLSGGLKPDVLAPTMLIAAQPCSGGYPSPGLVYTLPPCYGLSGGTSGATPVAAGAAAVLISAAKQMGLPHDAARIAWALRFGARVLPDFSAYEQGHGLVDVAAAWKLLQTKVEPLEIAVTAPVSTVLNRYLRMPGEGPGLYEREGWSAGSHGTRTIALRRTSGSRSAVRYGLRWRQNDGTFAAPATVMLPLDAAVAVPIRIAPATGGVHSAALEIVDRASSLPVHDILFTVIAAEPFAPENHYTVRAAKTIPWPRTGSFFVNVPPGTELLRLDLHVNAGRFRLKVDDPAMTDLFTWGSYFKPDHVPNGYFGLLRAGQVGTRLIPHPQPGVWEILVERPNERDPDDAPDHHVTGEVELVASVVGATAGAPSGRVTDASAIAVSWVAGLGALEHAAIVGELGTRRIRGGEADSSAPGPRYDIQVDSGTTTLRVAVTPADSAADLDLYLYDCTRGPCYLWDQDRSTRATKTHLVRHPHAGRWTVVIDPARVPTGKTAYTYTELQTHPTYGTVTASTAPGGRRTAERWTDSIRVARTTANSPEATEPVAVVDLVDEGAERAEQVHPLAVFAGLPYRPVVLATTVIPLDPRPKPRS